MQAIGHTIQKLCKLYNISPSKFIGQNFLVNEEILKKIVDSAKLTKDDTVLEVGPGFGQMTALLAEKVKKVIAVEIDKKLADVLRAQLINFKNIEIIQADILRLQATSYKLQAKYKVVANLPYNITSFFLRKFLTMESKPNLMVLLLQKEVAERICAEPGKMSLLSFSVQFYAKPEILGIVDKVYFWPKPEVDSAIIRITPYPRERVCSMLRDAGTGEKALFQIVKFGFSAKRKQLHNNLTAGIFSLLHKKIPPEVIKNMLKKAQIPIESRAQELSVEQWLELAKVIQRGLMQ